MHHVPAPRDHGQRGQPELLMATAKGPGQATQPHRALVSPPLGPSTSVPDGLCHGGSLPAGRLPLPWREEPPAIGASVPPEMPAGQLLFHLRRRCNSEGLSSQVRNSRNAPDLENPGSGSGGQKAQSRTDPGGHTWVHKKYWGELFLVTYPTLAGRCSPSSSLCACSSEPTPRPALDASLPPPGRPTALAIFTPNALPLCPAYLLSPHPTMNANSTRAGISVSCW